MIFKPELAEKVMTNRKWVTRRLPSDNPRSPWYRYGCKLRDGQICSVQPGRGKYGIGKVRIFGAPRLIELGHLGPLGAASEGFASPEDFEAAWVAINGEYDPTEQVWRVEFRPLTEHPGGSHD